MDASSHIPSLNADHRRNLSTSTSAETLIPHSKEARFTPEPFILSSKTKHRTTDSLSLDDFFLGPRELDRHSKWPMLLRIHGSCAPELVLPLIFVAGWTTTVCLFSRHVKDLGISHTLLTVLGFVVALSLSFRSSTAYERYMEGRKAWTLLQVSSQNLARNIWINATEREEFAKEDLIAKITALNLIVGFAQALKHRLRFEPYTHYSDLTGLVQHLHTFAGEATKNEPNRDAEPTSFWKSWGIYLGVPMAISNPRKVVKRAEQPLGNLPLEILNNLTVYLRTIVADGCFKANIYQTHALNAVYTLNDCMATSERILNTPLPLAYAICISQLTWVYILILPFQLYKTLGMVAIPGTLFAAYIILGFASIGNEIENPFGHDVNDLPLDAFCNALAADIDIIAATVPSSTDEFVNHTENWIMHPLNQDSAKVWKERSIPEIREALKKKTVFNMKAVAAGGRGKGKKRKGGGKSGGENGRYERVRASGREMV